MVGLRQPVMAGSSRSVVSRQATIQMIVVRSECSAGRWRPVHTTCCSHDGRTDSSSTNSTSDNLDGLVSVDYPTAKAMPFSLTDLCEVRKPCSFRHLTE
jgi:hypothetical protein